MKELIGTCKDCGVDIQISEYAVELEKKRGYSKPLRCNDCKKIHNSEIQSLGSSHFHLLPRVNPGTVLGSFYLGEIIHENKWSDRELHLNQEFYNDIRSKIGMRDDVEVKDLYEKLSAHQVVIAIAPTGTGKSTYLPYVLLNPVNQTIDGAENLNINGHHTIYRKDHFTTQGPILVSQPRVKAAVDIPTVVSAKLYGSPMGPGYMIGYKIGRQEDKGRKKKLISDCYDRYTKLIYITDGSLMNWIIQGRAHEFSIIIIDEAHERNVNIDVILMLLKRELIKYPHLKLIITSATINPKEFEEYFGQRTADGEILRDEKGNSVNVGICDFTDAREELLYEVEFAGSTNQSPDTVLSKVSDLVVRVYKNPQKKENGKKALGHILAFIPGVAEIENCRSELERILKVQNVKIIPLYSDAPKENLEDTTNNKDGKRRIYLATNIAETSLTIDNLDYVIETGVIKVNRWDPLSRRSKLELEWHSKAGCRQRWGRVGRGRIGWVYTVYSEAQFNSFSDYSPIGVLKENLEEVLIRLSMAGITDFHKDDLWLQKPNKAELDRCIQIYKQRELTRSGNVPGHLVTKYGEQVYQIADKVKYTVGKYNNDLSLLSFDIASLLMLCEEFGCLTEGCTMIAMLPFMGSSLYQRSEVFENDEIQASGMFVWDKNWPISKSIETISRQQSLFTDCRDDLDFVLKMYGLFENNAYLSDFPTNWIEYYGVDEDVFSHDSNNSLGIRELREELLEYFRLNASDKHTPKIAFNKTGLLRLLINIAWPDKQCSVINGVVKRYSDEASGIIHPFTSIHNKGIVKFLSCFHDTKLQYITSVEYEQIEKSGKLKPIYGFTSAFCIQMLDLDLPSRDDKLEILRISRDSDIDLLLPPQYKYESVNYAFNNLSSNLNLTLTNLVYQPPFGKQPLALVFSSTKGEKVYVDYSEASNLYHNKYFKIGRNFNFGFDEYVNLKDGISLLPFLIKNLKGIDTTNVLNGKVSGFFSSYDRLRVELDCILPENTHLTLRTAANNLTRLKEGFSIGDEIQFMVTKSFRTLIMRIDPDDYGEEEKEYIKAISDNKEILKENGFNYLQHTRSKNRYLIRNEDLDTKSIHYVSSALQPLKGPLLNYLSNYLSTSIDSDTIETTRSLKASSDFIRKIKESDNVYNEIESLDRKELYKSFSYPFANYIAGIIQQIQAEMRDQEWKNNKLDKDISWKQGKLYKEQLQLSKTRLKLATATNGNYRNRVNSWIMEHQQKIAVLQYEIDSLQSQKKSMDKNTIAKSIWSEETKSLYPKSLRYFQSFYLKSSNDNIYIGSSEPKSITSFEARDKFVIVNCRKYRTNKAGRVFSSNLDQIKTGDTLFLEFNSSRWVVIKSKTDNITKNESRKLNSKILERILQFRVVSVSTKSFTVNTTNKSEFNLLNGTFELFLVDD